VPSIVDVAEHDPAFADIHSRIQRGHAAPLRKALDRAARIGDIPSTVDRDAIAAALLGPLFYRRWFSREPIDAKFLDMIIRSTVAGLRQNTRKRK
jgi:Tetracyclin repressor-like, C-terminal domain